jgi:hypothetical protein
MPIPSLGVPIDIHIGVPDQHWTPPLPRYRTIHVADTAVVLLQESRIIRFSLRTSERLSDRSHGNHLVQPALGIRTYQNDHPRQRESRPDHTAGSRPSASESSSARLSSLGTSGKRPFFLSASVVVNAYLCDNPAATRISICSRPSRPMAGDREPRVPSYQRGKPSGRAGKNDTL